MNPIRTLIDTSQFRVGVVAGFFAFAVVASASAAVMVFRRERHPPPFAGAGLALASFLALTQAQNALPAAPGISRWLLLGLLLAGSLAEIAARVDGRTLVIAAAGIPGAVVTAGAIGNVPTWVRVFTAVVAAAGGALVADFDDRHALKGLGPVLTLVTIAAVYWTVPDTEAARTLLGVALVLAFLGWPEAIARLGVGGSVASWCLLAFVIGQGGFARPGSIVGAAGAIGVLGVEPILRSVQGPTRRRLYEGNFQTIVRVAAVQVVCAFASARFVGRVHSVSSALVRLALITPFVVALTIWSRPADDYTPSLDEE